MMTFHEFPSVFYPKKVVVQQVVQNEQLPPVIANIISYISWLEVVHGSCSFLNNLIYKLLNYKDLKLFIVPLKICREQLVFIIILQHITRHLVVVHTSIRITSLYISVPVGGRKYILRMILISDWRGHLFSTSSIIITEIVMQHASTTHTILTLDLGTHTGWAIRHRNGSITSGTASFKQNRFSGGGMVYLRFKQWLVELKQSAEGFDAVYFEEVRRHIGTDAAHKYGGFLAHLTAFCEHHSIPYQGVAVGTIKKHITGKGNASKQEVITAVKAKGFMPCDDNEADALALLDVVLQRYEGGGIMSEK